MNSPQPDSEFHSEVEYAFTPNFLDPNRIRSRRNTFTYGDFGTSQLPHVSLCPSPTVGSSSTDAHSELVPYSKEWTVILRSENAGQLVLYNTTNRRVSVRRLPQNNSIPSNQALSSPHMCALCRRPLLSTPTTSGSDFMHRNYFRLLENSESSFNQGYYERFFIEERKLGRGSRGSVFLCKHVLDNVHLGEYAIKKVAV
ncbi:16705_t:CDS:2, partial [Cetraspora pellucida]